MTKFLSHVAASDLLDSIRLQYFSGLMTWTEAMDRVAALRSMCLPLALVGLTADQILKLEQWPVQGDWDDDQKELARIFHE